METMSNGTSALAIIPERDGLLAVKTLHNLMVGLRTDVLLPDIDFGVIPGTGTKPTLYLPGMEKVMRALYAVPEYIERCVIRDYEKGIFHYEYECRLLDAVTGENLPGGRGLGMCTSHESSFRWRWVKAEQLPKGTDKETLEKRPGSISEFCFAVDKAETSGQYGKPDEYWQAFKDAIASGKARKIKRPTKKGEADAWEISTDVYRIPNPDIYDQVNAILKRAKKRALGDAVKGAAAISEFFTVDLEELHHYDDVVEGEYVVVETDPLTAPVAAAKPAPVTAAHTQPPPEKTAVQIEAERKAAEDKAKQEDTAKFLKMLTDGLDLSEVSIETAMQVLNITDKTDKEQWKKHGKTGKEIGEKIVQQLLVNDKPAAPKNGNPFGGAADKRHNWTDKEVSDMDALCATFYDVEFEAPLLVDRFLADTERVAWSSDFPTGPDAARAALMEYATDNQLPLIVGMATHTANHKATTFSNGLMLVTEYSRDRLRNLGEDWKTYVDGWSSAGGKYQFDRKGLPNLIISWESKNHESDGHEYKVCTEIDVLETA